MVTYDTPGSEMNMTIVNCSSNMLEYIETYGRAKCLVLSCVRLLYLSQNLSVFTKKNYHVLETFDIIKL